MSRSWRVWGLRSHRPAWEAEDHCVHLRLLSDWAVSRDPKERKPNPTQLNRGKDFSWNSWERCSVFSVLFKPITCNSGTSRSLGSQHRGRHRLKMWETNSWKCCLNTWSSRAWKKLLLLLLHFPGLYGGKKPLPTFFLGGGGVQTSEPLDQNLQNT